MAAERFRGAQLRTDPAKREGTENYLPPVSRSSGLLLAACGLLLGFLFDDMATQPCPRKPAIARHSALFLFSYSPATGFLRRRLGLVVLLPLPRGHLYCTKAVLSWLRVARSADGPHCHRARGEKC